MKSRSGWDKVGEVVLACLKVDVPGKTQYLMFVSFWDMLQHMGKLEIGEVDWGLEA